MLSQLERLICRARMDHHGPQRDKHMQVFPPTTDSWFCWLTPSTRGQQLISEITCCGGCLNKHILNPQCHMIAHPCSWKQPLWSMQPCNHVDVSVFVCGCKRPFIHPKWALTATSSCLSAALSSTPAPVSVDIVKVAAALLSQKLKCIYKFCQAVISLTLLLLAEVKCCYNANVEQVLQCTAVLLALGAHQLCRQEHTGAMQSRADGDTGQPSFQPCPAELSCRVLAVSGSKILSVLLMSKMRSPLFTAALWGGEAMQRPWNYTFKETTKAGKER